MVEVLRRILLHGPLAYVLVHVFGSLIQLLLLPNQNFEIVLSPDCGHVRWIDDINRFWTAFLEDFEASLLPSWGTRLGAIATRHCKV